MVALARDGLSAAQVACAESLVIHQELVERSPDDAEAQVALALALHNSGSVAMQLDDLDKAHAAYTRMEQILLHALEEDPDDTEFQQFLFACLCQVVGLAEARPGPGNPSPVEALQRAISFGDALDGGGLLEPSEEQTLDDFRRRAADNR